MQSQDTVAALVIYEDRIRTWREMKVLDSKLDNTPTAENIAELAELRIRNLLCFRELQSLNDTGKYLNEHPFLIHRAELSVLQSLWKSDRTGFIQEYSNCKTNIRRYRALLNKGELTDEQTEKYMMLLMKHQERETIFKKIIENEPNNNL